MPLRLAILLTFAAGPVLATGFQFGEIPATADVPPIEAAVWYPSDAAPPEAPNTPFGQAIAMFAPVVGSDLPLVVISHGDGGGGWDLPALEQANPRVWEMACTDAPDFDRAAFQQHFNRSVVEFFIENLGLPSR